MITKIDLLTVFSLLGLIFSVISVIVASYAAVKVVAMEKSTHSVQFMPVDKEIDEHNQALMDEETEDHEEVWATSDEELDKQRKLYNKDLEDIMPEFSTTDEDRKIRSF